MLKPLVSLSEKTSKKKTTIFGCRAIHVITEQLLSASLLTQGNHVSLSADTCALIDYQVKIRSALTLLHMNVEHKWICQQFLFSEKSEKTFPDQSMSKSQLANKCITNLFDTIYLNKNTSVWIIWSLKFYNKTYISVEILNHNLFNEVFP